MNKQYLVIVEQEGMEVLSKILGTNIRFLEVVGSPLNTEVILLATPYPKKTEGEDEVL